MISNFQSSHSLWGENSVERERVVVRNSITCCGGKWNRNVLFNIWWRNERILSKPIFPPFFLFLVTKYDFPIQTDTLNKASMDCSTITTFKKSNSDLKHFALCQKNCCVFFCYGEHKKWNFLLFICIQTFPFRNDSPLQPTRKSEQKRGRYES